MILGHRRVGDDVIGLPAIGDLVAALLELHVGDAGHGRHIVRIDLAELLEKDGEKKKAKAVLVAASVVLPMHELSGGEREELARKLR